MAVISTHQLARHYGRRRGIEDVDLTVQQGEIFGFPGPERRGKDDHDSHLAGLDEGQQWFSTRV